jgi:nucleotide-binding universal stress UspA family protein
MTVVLGYDESPGAEVALDTAIRVASQWGQPLTIVYGAGPPGGLGEEVTAHRDALKEIGQHALDRAVGLAEQKGVDTQVRLVDAKPAQALLDVADEVDATVIVVGTTGESPLRSAMLGSTPHKLLHLSSRPVLCVPVDG